MKGSLLGLCLILLGVAGAFILLIVTSKKPKIKRNSVVHHRRFKLDHEYENPGFTEKGQSDGVADIPIDYKIGEIDSHTITPLSPSITDDTNNSIPGDQF